MGQVLSVIFKDNEIMLIIILNPDFSDKDIEEKIIT